MSGDTSAGGLSRLDWSLADHPDAAIVELGSNDMLRGIAAGRDGKELRAILATLKQDHVAVLLAGMKAQRNLGAGLCAGNSMRFIRAWQKNTGVLFYPFMLDGVAMNPKAQPGRRHASQSCRA